MKWIDGGVTAAQGFLASGLSAGIKRSRKPDMSLVWSEDPAVCAGTLTSNVVKAAPVLLSRERLRGGVARGVLLNSGCANCMTGEPGLHDAALLGRAAADELRVPEQQLLLASTGIIGRRLPVPRMRRAIPSLVKHLSRNGHRQAALGILTTDTKAKEAAVSARIAGRTCSVGGMAKGAGMIAPSMATMLCVITTDVRIDRALLAQLVREAVDASFNCVSVDGDMSTNDTVFVLANGRSGITIRRGSTEAKQFAAMLQAVTHRLAYLIVKDGEGATRIATIEVEGGRSDRDAARCARQIATSSLVRTMLASGDPNVGRIGGAAGASGARFDPDKLEIRIGHHVVVRGGVAKRIGKNLADRLFSPTELTIRVHLHAGSGRGRMMACDLTEEYVRLNARYS